MAFCTVGCGYPNGLILDLGDKRVVLNGANASLVIGGYGITEGVDKEFMDAWFEKFSDNDIVTKGHVFYADKVNSVTAEAKEKADEKTGLEALDPSKKPKGIEEAKG